MRFLSLELAVHNVRCNGQAVLRVSCGTEFPLGLRSNFMISHEAFDSVLSAGPAFRAKLFVDAWTAVRLPRILEDLHDPLQKKFSARRTLRWFSIEPLVIGSSTDIQCLAQLCYVVLVALCANEGVLYFRLFAKYAAAFFSISFSSLSSLISF